MKLIYTIDSAGRVSVPIKIRKRLGWEPGDNIMFRVIDGKLVVEKVVVETEDDK